MAHGAIGPGSLVASRFRLEDLLEEHSGARFWRATDLTLARNVAIHVIAADDPRAPAVLTAARTSATVSDGHILRVLDALEEGDVVHVVHEWGAGSSLDRMLAEETLDPRRAAWLVREVAEAIAVAHRHGVAHGRLLPENVMLTDAGSVKLIGFVVDAVLHGRPQRPGAEGDPPSEHESDVLNLGALLFACLTGKWPGFPESVLPDAPLDHGRVCRPRQVRPGVPRQLDTLCDQIINPDPRTGRPKLERAADVSAALSEFLGDSLGSAGLPVSGPTAFLDPGALKAPSTRGTLGSFDGVPAPVGGGDDPEATQASIPQLDTTDPTLDPIPDSGNGAGPDSGAHPGRDEPFGSGARLPGTGMGAGAAPPRWGPDRSDDTDAWPPAEADERPGSSWLWLGALIGVLCLVLLAVVVGFYVGSKGSGDDGSTTEPSASPSRHALEVVQPASVTAFDPDGSGALTDENPDEVPLATDGDPSTSWETLGYNDGPQLAPFKSGVGLLLDLGEETDVTQVKVSLVGSGYDLELLATPESSGAPTGVEGLAKVADETGASGTVTLAGSETVRTRYLVVWLTAVPQSSEDGRYRGAISEVVVRS